MIFSAIGTEKFNLKIFYVLFINRKNIQDVLDNDRYEFYSKLCFYLFFRKENKLNIYFNNYEILTKCCYVVYTLVKNTCY